MKNRQLFPWHAPFVVGVRWDREEVWPLCDPFGQHRPDRLTLHRHQLPLQASLRLRRRLRNRNSSPLAAGAQILRISNPSKTRPPRDTTSPDRLWAQTRLAQRFPFRLHSSSKPHGSRRKALRLRFEIRTEPVAGKSKALPERQRGFSSPSSSRSGSIHMAGEHHTVCGGNL